jgi:hypothetical protein
MAVSIPPCRITTSLEAISVSSGQMAPLWSRLFTGGRILDFLPSRTCGVRRALLALCRCPLLRLAYLPYAAPPSRILHLAAAVSRLDIGSNAG